MKKIKFSILALIGAAALSNAQIGVGTASPKTTIEAVGTNNGGAVAAKDGVLVPRVSDLVIDGTETGQLVFLTAIAGDFIPGFHYWNGTVWTPLADTVLKNGNVPLLTNRAQSKYTDASGNFAHNIRTGHSATDDKQNFIDFNLWTVDAGLTVDQIGVVTPMRISGAGPSGSIQMGDFSGDAKANLDITGTFLTSGLLLNFAENTGDSFPEFAEDHVIISNNAAATAKVTLDDDLGSGVLIIVKNINATPLSIVTTGATSTIDGQTSITMVQWETKHFMFNGTNWYILN